MLRAILGFKRRAIYVLPYISIVSEKCHTLLRVAENINLKIIQLHSASEVTWTPDVDLTICTIEKANSLMNKLIEEQIYLDVSFFLFTSFI
jgi:DNA polymerase theta